MSTNTLPKLKWKVCGMTVPENIEQVLALRPDFLGFIFYPKSPRYMAHLLTPAFVKGLQGVQKVGVFVNAPLDEMWHAVESYGLDLVQLHGQETPATCRELREYGVGVIKAFSVGADGLDFGALKAYEAQVDYFLFDTRGKHPGGNGVPFSWELLEAYLLEKPFFLSGGIGNESIEALRAFRHPQWLGVDINSRFEDAPGLKNKAALEAFYAALFLEM